MAALVVGVGVLILGTRAPDPAEALATLRHAAAGGEAGAQLLLGLAYRDGRDGLKPDAAQALAWLERAAGNGVGGAQRYAQDLVSRLYAPGRGADPVQTADRWRVAAQRRLGEAYRDGATLDAAASASGSTRPSALAWLGDLFARLDPNQQTGAALKQRAAAGDALAQYQLALRYETGAWAVARDPGRALYWFERAAESGNVLAMRRLSQVYARGELGTAADPVRADAWRQRADALAG